MPLMTKVKLPSWKYTGTAGDGMKACSWAQDRNLDGMPFTNIITGQETILSSEMGDGG